jgi:hypothetical protein
VQTGRRESCGGLIMWNIYDGVDAFLKNVPINNIVVNTRVRVQSVFFLRVVSEKVFNLLRQRLFDVATQWGKKLIRKGA